MQVHVHKMQAILGSHKEKTTTKTVNTIDENPTNAMQHIANAQMTKTVYGFNSLRLKWKFTQFSRVFFADAFGFFSVFYERAKFNPRPVLNSLQLNRIVINANKRDNGIKTGDYHRLLICVCMCARESWSHQFMQRHVGWCICVRFSSFHFWKMLMWINCVACT